MSLVAQKIKRAEGAVHGLLMRADAVSELMDSPSAPPSAEDRTSLATILGGIQVMADAIRDVLSNPQEAEHELFDQMLDQADRTMGRFDAVFA